MDKTESQKFARDVEENVLKSVQEDKFPLWRRSHWDEWGSPVGLGLSWALFIIPLGLFLYFLHLAGLIK
ncbi:MAG: hypothetical protein WC773_02015 [Patescibacteria group bacterium]|jgi:hypothetical protein